MAGNARYDEDRIDYGAVYFSIMPDEAIRPAFDTKGAVKVDADGVPVIAESLTLVKIGTFREPTGKVDRPVFQADQIHAYDTGELAKFRKATKADRCRYGAERQARSSARACGRILTSPTTTTTNAKAPSPRRGFLRLDPEVRSWTETTGAAWCATARKAVVACKAGYLKSEHATHHDKARMTAKIRKALDLIGGVLEAKTDYRAEGAAGGGNVRHRPR